MKHLNSLLLDLNVKLESGIKHSYKSHGLTLIARKEAKSQDMELIDLEEIRIYPSDLQDVYFYHRLKDESYKETKGAGLHHGYKKESSIDLIVFSKIDADEYFESMLQKQPNVIIKSKENDSYKIAESEWSLKAYDFKKFYIFSINYTLSYQIQKCLEL